MCVNCKCEFIADGLRVGNGDANGASTDEARVGIAASRSLMVDLLDFLPKSESNSQLVQNKVNFFLSSHLINFSSI